MTALVRTIKKKKKNNLNLHAWSTRSIWSLIIFHPINMRWASSIIISALLPVFSDSLLSPPPVYLLSLLGIKNESRMMSPFRFSPVNYKPIFNYPVFPRHSLDFLEQKGKRKIKKRKRKKQGESNGKVKEISFSSNTSCCFFWRDSFLEYITWY